MPKCKCAVVFSVLFLTAFFVAADPVEGYWIATNQMNGEHLCGWQFYVEDGVLYGKILSAKGATSNTVAAKCTKDYPNFPVAGDVSKMKLLGTPFIYGLTSTEYGKWEGGYIINPDSGSLYRCKIQFHPADGKKFKEDTLEMYGMLKNINIGVRQYWPSGTKSDIDAIK